MSKKTNKKIQIPSLNKFKLLYDNVLLKALDSTEVSSGLIRPDQYEDKPEFGVVVAAGPGKVLDNGETLPMKVKEGDIVFYGKYSTEKTSQEGEDYYIIKEEDIKAVFNPQ